MSLPSFSLRAFAKPWKSYADQVGVLVARGLHIPDVKDAANFLSHINYYRFSGYCLAFEQSRHVFHANVTFDDIRRAYEFDWGLRDLISDALEVIEIDIRATVAQHFGQKYGPFGHANAANFFYRFNHFEWLTKLHEESTRSPKRHRRVDGATVPVPPSKRTPAAGNVGMM